MQDGRKAVWSIPYISVAAFLPSLKQNFIAYRSSKVSSHPDCVFEIHQLWQSGFSRVYSNCCCSSSFVAEILKIGQSSHKFYSNNIVNFQESSTILNARTEKIWKLIVCTSYEANLGTRFCQQNNKQSHIQWIFLCHHHHHHVVPLARISLSLSSHFSLSYIASGRSSGLHPVSSQSYYMYVRAGRPAFARPYVGGP